MDRLLKLTILIIAALLLTLGAANAEFTFSQLPDGSMIITGMLGEDSEITVPAMLGGNPVSEIGEGAFKDNLYITSVRVSEGVKVIGDEAFKNCVNLESVALPEDISVSETAFDNTPYFMNAYRYEHLFDAGMASGGAQSDAKPPVSEGAHIAGVIIGIIIVLLAVLAYFVILPCARKAEASEGGFSFKAFVSELKQKMKAKKDTSSLKGRESLKNEAPEAEGQTDAGAQSEEAAKEPETEQAQNDESRADDDDMGE